MFLDFNIFFQFIKKLAIMNNYTILRIFSFEFFKAHDLAFSFHKHFVETLSQSA